LTYLPGDILTKVDRATMSVSLEGREPLLDHRIIEFAARIPTKLKFKNGVKKYLLKEIAHNYIPRELLDRPKMGFGVPVRGWMRNELKDITLDFLNEESLKRSGMFDVGNIIGLRDEYLKGDTTNFELIWYMLVFQLWSDQ
jgi:asparagine synthase (glutamine-hydrolysing)